MVALLAALIVLRTSISIFAFVLPLTLLQPHYSGIISRLIVQSARVSDDLTYIFSVRRIPNLEVVVTVYTAFFKTFITCINIMNIEDIQSGKGPATTT